jgi:hypothetical protein
MDKVHKASNSEFIKLIEPLYSAVSHEVVKCQLFPSSFQVRESN